MKSAFLCQIRDTIRAKHYSIRTEQAYLYWTNYFIRFHQMRHPKDMGDDEIRAFLNFLALEPNVAANTQKVALNALVFVYRHVLAIEPGSAEGYYIHLENLTAPITKGQHAPLLLTFEHGDRYLVEAVAVNAGTHLHGDESDCYEAHKDH
jgi:hypothetical protein